MRDGLDETLARMARREDALRRRAAEPTGSSGREAGAHRLESDAAVDDDPVQEVAEALRRVVAGHPGLAVSVQVELGGRTYPLRVAWTGGEVTLGAEPDAPPPAWPMSVKTVPGWAPGQRDPAPDPAARLAELIRRDPSLLSDRDPQR
ncbi:hypothetical protein [Micromonospora sp. NPDC051006]|uniref:hypothetical protein n=1 Tax=Micromonospora sp. NPDC051006 TaxID=3364283 RepID=UPI00378EBFAB